jgi:hypothetical protein
MKTTYKIVHPANVRDWVAANHAVGKNVRMIDAREEGHGDVPAMSASDYLDGCLILAVEEPGFSDPVLKRIEREVPQFAAALLRHQEDHSLSEAELLASLRRCCVALIEEQPALDPGRSEG